MALCRSEKWASKRHTVSGSLMQVHAVHSLPDCIKNIILKIKIKVTHERCIIELIVKNE